MSSKVVRLTEKERVEISDILLGIFTKDDELETYAKHQRNPNELIELNGYYSYINGIPDAKIELVWRDASADSAVLISSKLVADFNAETNTYTLAVASDKYSISMKQDGDSEVTAVTTEPVHSLDVYDADGWLWLPPAVEDLMQVAMQVYEIVEQGLGLRLQNWDIS